MDKSEFASQALQVDVDYGDVVVEIPSIVNFIQIVWSLEFVSLENHLYGLVENGFTQLAPVFFINLMHFTSIHLIP